MNALTIVLLVLSSMALGVVIVVFYFACMWSIFKKAGLDGWWCVIPLANIYQLYRIAFGNGWLFLLCFIPGVNVVMGFVCIVKLGLNFDKSVAFCVGLALLPAVFIPIIAMDNSTYIGPTLY